MTRIHVVGTGPRTGTTLLTECLKACFAIDASSAHEARLSARHRGRGIFLTKWAADVDIVSARLKVDPDLFVICMMRDPRDTITSRHRLAPDHYWAPLRFWNERVPHVRRLQYHPRFLVIRYEDFVTNPTEIQELIERRIPVLRRTADFRAFHRLATPSPASELALGRTREIDGAGVGRWRTHLPRVAWQLALHGPISDDLVEFGYERDATWLAILDGVEPDVSPSHWPDVKRPSFSPSRFVIRYAEALKATVRRITRGRSI